jgi:hypothetical protein
MLAQLTALTHLTSLTPPGAAYTQLSTLTALVDLDRRTTICTRQSGDQRPLTTRFSQP